MILLFILAYLHAVSGQASQWIDTFQKTVCHQRWAQMDWLSILRPCRNKMDFAKKIDDKERTSTKWSHTLGLHFEKTGEFSKLAIQSRKADGRNKKTGGDTWRVFIRGADNITPFISDLNNGVYEADFIALSPGFYKVEIVLESTLCQAYEEPPPDWLKRDAKTIIADEKAKLLWQPMRGGNISFRISTGSKDSIAMLKKNFYRYKDSCGAQFKCELLWRGIGRWSNKTWMPYVNESLRTSDSDVGCYKTKEGVLKITGDDLTRRFSLSNNTKTLCNGVFKECRWERPGEQPNSQLYTSRNGTSTESKTFSTKTYLENLKKLLNKDYMDESSGLLFNYGHSFVQNIGFKRYRSFIDRAARIVKEKFKGRAVWLTMASRWMESNAPEDHFKNHQRIKLFNAYATSVMCNAGIAVLDTFQMTESVAESNKEAVLEYISDTLIEYFRSRPTLKCPDKEKEASEKRSQLLSNATFAALVDSTPVNDVVQRSVKSAVDELGSVETTSQMRRSKLELMEQF